VHGLHQVRARGASDSIIANVARLSKERGAIGAWAFALALILLALPLHSPDLFWHLSAGRWILANLAIPRADPFSFTAYGTPWVDFEWLAQALWYGAHAAGGLKALWAFKGVLLLAAYWPVDGLLRDKGASSVARGAALALWCCAALAQADLRADLFSAALFAVVLRRLEGGRASFLFGFGLFALWSNLHAGFPAGLGLYAAYALAARFMGGRRIEGLGAEACGALLGALLNPYGLSVYGAHLAHLTDPVGRYVLEWGGVEWRMRFHRPLIAALVAGAALARAAKTGSPGSALAAAGLAFATALSARFGIFFGAAAAACAAHALPRLTARQAALPLALATALLAHATARVRWGEAFSDVYVARRAADFVAAERAAFGPLRVFNTYEWGGYLGWILGPEGRVYGDGRYLFHSQLPALQEALTGPAPMAEFLERERLDALLIRSYPDRMAGTMAWPDGSRTPVARPWYVSYLPRERWALVWWDEQALVFVDRRKVPGPWLAAREFKWWRPGDEQALAGALERGLADPAAVEAEKARQGR
jgi:hypothetical protein